MESSKTHNYIKCLNRTDLIKFLREENYTAVADILRLRDIDGIRFLELNELDLVQWRLNPKQKKLILECRDKLIDKKTSQMLNKPPLAMKPTQFLRPRNNSNNGKIAELQSKLQLEKIPCNVTKIAHSKSKVTPNARNSNDDQYMDMTQDNAQVPLKPIKNIKNSNINPNENMPNQYPHMMQNTQKTIVKSLSLTNPSELGAKPSNKYHKKSSLPTPPQFLLPTFNEGFNIDIQNNEENYENPDDIKPDMKFENTKRVEDQEIYEDPDMDRNQKTRNHLSAFTQNLGKYEDDYEDPNDIGNGKVIKALALPERVSNFQRNRSNFRENDENHEENDDISKNQINKFYPFNDVKPQRLTRPFLYQNKPTADNKFTKNYQDETYEEPNDVHNNPKILSKFQKPHNFLQNKIQDGDELYEDPQEIPPETYKKRTDPPGPIMTHQNPRKTKIPSDDETYEDPDMVKTGNTFSKNTIEIPEEEDYGIQLEKKKIHNQKNCIMSRPLPPLPPKSFAEAELPAVPPKLKDVARKHSKDDFFNNEPRLRPLRSSDNEIPVLPPVPLGYDNHRLSKKTNSCSAAKKSSDVNGPLDIRQIHTNVCWDDSLPSPPLEFGSKLPEEKGNIWNSFDQSGLPTPPTFERKFKHADSAYMKVYVEAEGQGVSSRNFNPNDFPFFRNTDRIGGRQLLERIKNIQNGAFLIRKSNEFFLVITMFYKNRFYNVGIDKNDDGTIYCKTTEDKEPKSFNTLYQFVEYYKTHPLTMTTKGTVINIYLIEQLTPDIF